MSAAISPGAALALLAAPPAICATWIRNHQAWQSDRIYRAHAYVLLFYLAYLLRWQRARKPVWISAALLCWLLINLGSQQVKAIAFKSLYEQAFVQRSITRVEPRLPLEPDGRATALDVIGERPTFESSKSIRLPMAEGSSHALSGSRCAMGIRRTTSTASRLHGQPDSTRHTNQLWRWLYLRRCQRRMWQDS